MSEKLNKQINKQCINDILSTFVRYISERQKKAKSQ
jgi:hypothetical protein